MKTIKTLILSVLISASFVAHVEAQKAGVYTLLNGGTTYLPSQTTNVINPNTGTTNTYNVPAAGNSAANTNLLFQTVADYDYVGFTYGETGTVTSTNDVLIYKSMDNGLTFEKTASFQYTGIAPGAAAYLTNATLDVHGVTHLAVEIRSKGTTTTTNALLEFNLKSPKVQARQATQ